MIDTPGHVDFNYEVSRSLAACDGAILVVDAAQGIEAQTLANVYLALDHDLDVFPVINKIDLPSADPERVKNEIEDVIGIEAQDAPLISAKNGIGIEDVLEAVVAKIPAPRGNADNPLSALIFDSVYDSYKGVIVFCRIMEGTVRKGMNIKMMATGATAEVVEVGYFGPGQFIPCEELSAGMVGYLTASIKNVKDTAVGDTITDVANSLYFRYYMVGFLKFHILSQFIAIKHIEHMRTMRHLHSRCIRILITCHNFNAKALQFYCDLFTKFSTAKQHRFATPRSLHTTDFNHVL